MMNWGLEPLIAIARAITARYRVSDVPEATEPSGPAQKDFFDFMQHTHGLKTWAKPGSRSRNRFERRGRIRPL
jgi:hypothetical protein